MIDPKNITDFNRTEKELQEFLLFAVSVAGKTASVQAEKLEKFLKGVPIKNSLTPFQKIRFLVLKDFCSLDRSLRSVKIGKYSLLTDSFRSLSFSGINLRNISHSELQEFPGIGPKTSRFFILHSRPTASVACLDTHILKWLSSQFPNQQIPNTTPTGKEYRDIEEKFLDICKKKNEHPAELDLKIWRSYNENKKVPSI